jgi:phage terminase large subunit-like protein
VIIAGLFLFYGVSMITGEIYDGLKKFKPRDGFIYKAYYDKILGVKEIREDAEKYINQAGKNKFNHINNKYLATIRHYLKTDLFFLVNFGIGVDANDPKGFVLDKCYEIEADEKSYSDGICDSFHYVWARGHFKSTLITIGATAMYHLNFPEHSTCIFSFKKGNANKFLQAISDIYKMDEVKHAFSDLLGDIADSKEFCSMDRGLILNRRSRRKERTIETAGLMEGMPTGSHYNVLRFDDIETDDIAESCSQLTKSFSKFQMAQHLGMVTGDTLTTVAGTPYSHMGPIQTIRDLRDVLGIPTYKTTVCPAEDEHGEPVLMTRKQLDKYKVLNHYRAQMMCDPSPTAGSEFSSRDLLTVVAPPPGLYQFMIVDPAGDKGDKADGDFWSIMCVGVERTKDEHGYCNVYITDMVIDRFHDQNAIKEIVKMFIRNHDVQAICVEQTNISAVKGWVQQELKEKRGIMLSEKTNTLIALKPQGMGSKITRIKRGLSTPLSLKKIHISAKIPQLYRQRLNKEMDEFPYGAHDDGIDCLSWYGGILNTLNYNYLIEIKSNNAKIDYKLSHKYRQSGCSHAAF